MTTTLDNKQLYSCSCHNLNISDVKLLERAESCISRTATFLLMPLREKRLQWNAFRYGKYKTRTGNTHGKGRQWRNDAHVVRIKKSSSTPKKAAA